MNGIPKQVAVGLKQVAEETVGEAASNAVKVVDSVITGKDLVGDIKPMSAGEYQQKQQEDETVKQKEISEIGRNVEKEMDEARKKRKEAEDEREKEFLENLKKQREAEGQEVVELTRKHPRPKRGGAFARGGKAKPSQSDMSATGEFKGKVD